MSIPVFLSHPTPFLKKQQDFLDRIKEYLSERNFCPRTLGVTDFDLDQPLTAIRRMMLESNGVLVVAFRRYEIIKGRVKPNSDIEGIEGTEINNEWQTSPWCQIEPAMAFQIGLPVLVLREKGVIADGILEKGVLGTYLPEFDLAKSADTYLVSQEWKQLVSTWEGQVRNVVKTKGHPPKLY